MTRLRQGETFVLSQQQIAHFDAFGFVVLHGLLDDAEAAALTAEATAALGDAFGRIGTDIDPEGTGGIRGDYLPLSVDRTPLSQSLIADDPRLFQGSAELLGGPTVPTPPIATCFQHDRRFDGLSDDVVECSLGCLSRDERLRQASGRWVPGRPDPQEFVPGDVAAIRVGAGKPILIRSWQTDTHGGTHRVLFEPRGLRQHPMKTLDLVDLTCAVPYFIPTTAAIGVLASHPPDHDLQQRLRLPFDRVLVVFGADLELDPRTHRWPSDYPHRQLPRHSIARQVIDRGGFVSGMMLLADQAGRLRDDLLWIVAANPDPTLPWPASLDRVRGVLRGWRSASTLAPLVTNLAAAVAWGAWQPPAAPLPLPDPESRRWRKAVKRGVFRRREPRGDAVGVHVLDLGRTPTQTRHISDPGETTTARRNSPITHLRGGHFRRVRVGPRNDWHYDVRWIAPTLVRGDQPAGERLVIRCLPPPPAWNRTPDLSDPQALDPQASSRGGGPSPVSLPGPDGPHALDIP
jgi:hypothetical protein